MSKYEFLRNSTAQKIDGTEVAVDEPRYETGKYGSALTIEAATAGTTWSDIADMKWSDL